mgnify:CR=1 FL=1
MALYPSWNDNDSHYLDLVINTKRITQLLNDVYLLHHLMDLVTKLVTNLVTNMPI